MLQVGYGLGSWKEKAEQILRESCSGLKEGQAANIIRLGRNADSWGPVKKGEGRGYLRQESGQGKVKPLFYVNQTYRVLVTKEVQDNDVEAFEAKLTSNTNRSASFHL